MSITISKLESLLQAFDTSTTDVEGAGLISPDGLPLATSLPNGMDEERTSAMSAAMLSLGERICRELSRGAIDRIQVQGEKGYAILVACGEDAVFIAFANEQAKQGLLMLEIKRLVTELKRILIG